MLCSSSFQCETKAFHLFSLTDLSVLLATGLRTAGRTWSGPAAQLAKVVLFMAVCCGKGLKTVPSLLNVSPPPPPSPSSILTCSIVIIVTRSFKIKWASVNFKILIYYSIVAPLVGSERLYRCVWRFKVPCYWRRRGREWRPLSLSPTRIDQDKDDEWSNTKDCVSLHQQMYHRRDCGKSLKPLYMYCFWMWAVMPVASGNLTFDPCGLDTATFLTQPEEKGRARGSPSIFLFVPVIFN